MPKSYVDGVTFSNKNNNTAKNYGLSKIRQFNDSGTISIYFIRRIRLGKLDGRGLVWVPLCTSSQDRQDFPLIQPAQKGKETMHIYFNRSLVIDACMSIKNILRLKCGFEWKGQIFQNFIVSFVKPPQVLNQDEKMNQFDNVIEVDSIHWVCVFPKNVSHVDHPVECFDVFRGYPWQLYRRLLDDAHNSLLLTTYHWRGLDRPQLSNSQRGNLQMIGLHQSNQASNNMGKVSGTINHHYWVEKAINTPLIQQTAALSSALSEHAVDIRKNNSGQVIIGLLKKVTM